jgi:hypothetical protein
VANVNYLLEIIDVLTIDVLVIVFLTDNSITFVRMNELWTEKLRTPDGLTDKYSLPIHPPSATEKEQPTNFQTSKHTLTR